MRCFTEGNCTAAVSGSVFRNPASLPSAPDDMRVSVTRLSVGDKMLMVTRLNVTSCLRVYHNVLSYTKQHSANVTRQSCFTKRVCLPLQHAAKQNVRSRVHNTARTVRKLCIDNNVHTIQT